MPTVSIIMPVYNGELYLAPAMDSLLNQTYADFEVIAVDDGSTDGSPHQLCAYAKKDSRVRVARIARGGLAIARNEAVRLAQGSLLACMDCDDISHRTRLSEQVACMERQPELVALGAHARIIDPSGTPLAAMSPKLPLLDEQIRSMLPTGNIFIHPTMMMRTEVIRKVGGYRSAFPPAEDYDLWLRLMDVGKFANLSRALLDYRIHPKQVSFTAVEQQAISVVAARHSLRLRREGKPDPFDFIPLATREVLHHHGVQDSEIDETIVEHLMGQALSHNMIHSSGHSEAVEQLRRLGPQFGLGSYPVARFWFEAGYRELVHGRPVRGARWMLSGVLRNRQVRARFLRLLWNKIIPR